MAEVRAVRLLPRNGATDPRLIPAPTEPGEFRFTTLSYMPCEPQRIKPGAIGRLDYGCPRGRGNCGGIIIGNGVKPSVGAPSWTWNGDADAPSLTPSINCRTHTTTGEPISGCGWHGWLTAGIFSG